MFRSSPPGSTPNRAGRDELNPAPGAGRWFQQPVLWLGAAILAVVLAGCILTIVLATRHADAPIETSGGSVMKVPVR